MVKSPAPCVTFLILFISSAAFAQLGSKDSANLKSSDLKRVKVGNKAPDFTLENMDGQEISLADFRGKKNVILIFYRGRW